MESLSDLGSLAQEKRLKQLKTAKGLLIVIGILSMIVNAIMMTMIPKQVEDVFAKEIAQLHSQNLEVDWAQVAELKASAIRVAYVIQFSGCILGAIFVGLGFMVYRYPVVCTMTGLVLYIASAAIFGLLDPASLLQGLLIKIVIVICLVKSVQAAQAYEKARQELELDLAEAPAIEPL